MTLPYYCTNCYAVMVNGICPDCSQHPTTTSGTTNDLQVVASKPPAPTVVETSKDCCKHCGSPYIYHDGVSVLCSNLQAAQLQIERLRAEVAARYTEDDLKAWLEHFTRGDYYGCDALDLLSGGQEWCSLAAFIANQRKEKP